VVRSLASSPLSSTRMGKTPSPRCVLRFGLKTTTLSRNTIEDLAVVFQTSQKSMLSVYQQVEIITWNDYGYALILMFVVSLPILSIVKRTI
jgi:hypothetical protein